MGGGEGGGGQRLFLERALAASGTIRRSLTATCLTNSSHSAGMSSAISYANLTAMIESALEDRNCDAPFNRLQPVAMLKTEQAGEEGMCGGDLIGDLVVISLLKLKLWSIKVDSESG